MENKNKDLFSVENLLEDAQFSPSPAFQTSLFNHLQEKLSPSKKDHLMHFTKGLDNSQNRRKNTTWRWVLTGMFVLCLAFGSLVVMVPEVRAQMITLSHFFGLQLPFDDQGVVRSPFTPLAPEKIPAEMNHFVSYNQEAGGPVYIELRYFSQDTFLVIDEAQAPEGFVLPEGEAVRIGQMNGIAERNLDGMVFLAAQAPQPWRTAGSGGGGGESEEGSSAPPQNLVYHGATRLTWVQSGLEIELLTNLPYSEALRQAGSLIPAAQLKK